MQTKFKIIETPDYILAVSDEETQTGYYYNELDKALRKGNAQQSYHASVIAYQPKGNAPELDLPLLPQMIVEDDVEKLAELKYPISKEGSMWMPTAHDCNQANKQEGFIEGYKAATKVYSEEDLRRAIDFGSETRVFTSDRETITSKRLKDEFIQSLKQPTPKWFVADVENKIALDGHTVIGQELKITIINGKTYLVGKYCKRSC
jgi:hypothetical protein